MGQEVVHDVVIVLFECTCPARVVESNPPSCLCSWLLVCRAENFPFFHFISYRQEYLREYLR